MRSRCEKCGVKPRRRRNSTRHHVYPQCFFGGIGLIHALCAKCHDKIEEVYRQAEGTTGRGKRKRLSKWRYESIFYEWLGGDK